MISFVGVLVPGAASGGLFAKLYSCPGRTKLPRAAYAMADAQVLCFRCAEPRVGQGACARCKMPYCGRACQKADWQFNHRQLCDFVRTADSRAAEAASAAVAACKGDVVRGASCYICLTEGPGLVRGCACRGDAGYAHVACLIRAEAELGPESRDGLGQCPTCRQYYHGAVRLAVAWGEWRAVARCNNKRFFDALRELGMALHECDQHEDALVLIRCRLKYIKAGWPQLEGRELSESQVAFAGEQANLANILGSLGKQDEACGILRECFSLSKRAKGVEAPDTISVAVNLANNLKVTRHFQEARKLLEEMLPLSRKVMGSLDTSTINLAVLLGDVLQACEIQPDGNMQLSLDTARAVAKLYDEAYASSRRLFGDDHPETRDNKWRAEGMREMFEEQGISLDPEAPHPT